MAYPPMPDRAPALPAPPSGHTGPERAAQSRARPIEHPGIVRALVGAALALLAWQPFGYLPWYSWLRPDDSVTVLALSFAFYAARGVIAIGAAAIAASRPLFMLPMTGAVALGWAQGYLQPLAYSALSTIGPALVSAAFSSFHCAVWIAARGRPPGTYNAVLLAVFLPILTVHQTGLSLTSSGFVNPSPWFPLLDAVFVVGGAWLAYAIDPRRPETADTEARTAPHLVASGSVGLPTGVANRTAATQPINALAIASIISVFFTTTGGLILGHMALSRIKATGEPGRGLALAAVIIGWTFTGVTVIVLVVYFGALTSLLRSY